MEPDCRDCQQLKQPLRPAELAGGITQRLGSSEGLLTGAPDRRRQVALTQFVSRGFDYNYSCT
jgi:hypothetical protein